MSRTPRAGMILTNSPDTYPSIHLSDIYPIPCVSIHTLSTPPVVLKGYWMDGIGLEKGAVWATGG